MTFIYGLIDPRTEEVRYIGKSNDPQERLRQHMKCRTVDQTYKAKWLRQLKSSGIAPILIILEQCEEETWEACEISWIAFGRQRGWPLTNTCDGGGQSNGFAGHHHSQEAKKRQAEYWTGKSRPHSSVHTANLSAAMKKRGSLGPQTLKHRQKIGEKVKMAAIAEQRGRGEKNVKAKLTESDVREIRLADRSRGHRQKLARQYGVSPQAISSIWAGITWSHVI